MVLLFCAATVVTGESQTRPGVALQFAPALDDSESDPSLPEKARRGQPLAEKERQSGTPNLPGVNSISPPQSLLLVDPAFAQEVEPNGTFATASPLSGTSARVQANLFPNGDVDFYSFNATAGPHLCGDDDLLLGRE